MFKFHEIWDGERTLKSKFDQVNVVDSRIIYNKHDRVVVKDTLEFADGSKHEWVYFKTHGAVAVVACTDDNRVILTKQYRHPMRKIIADLPAGGIANGETPEQAALRELEEETGFTAEKLEWLGRFSWAPSNMEGCVEIFLARDLKPTGNFDPDQIASIEMANFNDVLDGVLKGEYIDSALVIATLLISLKKPFDL
jgi:ADP-ribose pyrophosphatase